MIEVGRGKPHLRTISSLVLRFCGEVTAQDRRYARNCSSIRGTASFECALRQPPSGAPSRDRRDQVCMRRRHHRHQDKLSCSDDSQLSSDEGALFSSHEAERGSVIWAGCALGCWQRRSRFFMGRVLRVWAADE